MISPGQWLLGLIAHALESAERDVVLGDIAESGENFAAALHNLLGLVARRQGGLWRAWQPWVALIGISGVTGMVLSRIRFRFNVDLGQQFMAYRKYGVHFETGLSPREDVAFLICSAGALVVWSWLCGFVLGSLSGKAAWLTWSLFYLTVLNSAWIRFVLAGDVILVHPRVLPMLVGATLPLQPADILFLLAATFGTIAGVRRTFVSVPHARLLGSLIIAITILMTWMGGWYETAHEVWSEGAWHGISWNVRIIPFLLASWPAVYLLVSAYRQRHGEMKSI